MIRPVFLTLLLGAAPLVAQPAKDEAVLPPGVPITLADATVRALAHNYEIALQRETFRMADAGILRADGSYDPSFRLDARWRRHTDPVNSILSGAPSGEIASSAEGYAANAGLGFLLATGATVNVTASAARDLSNNIFTILSPAYSTSLGCDLWLPLLVNLGIDPARRAVKIAASTSGRSPSPTSPSPWRSSSAGRAISTRRRSRRAARSSR